MEEKLARKIIAFQERMGFTLKWAPKRDGYGKLHDESLSGSIALRFRGRSKELKSELQAATDIVSALRAEYEANKKESLVPYLELFSALADEMRSIEGEKGNLIVSLNYRCNSDCVFCADSREQRRRDDRDFEELVEELKDNRERFDSLIISGGEPTIYPWIIDYVKTAHGLGYSRITLVTNCFMLAEEEFLARLIEAGVDRFQVSFLTTEPEDYSRITGVKDSHGLAVKAIRNMKAAGRPFSANTVIHKHNYSRLAGIVSFLIEEGAESINLAFMNPVGSSVSGGRSEVAVSYKSALPFVLRAFAEAESRGFDRVYIENFPLCIAPGLIDRISDLRQPEANKEYYTAGKAKPKKCAECRYNSMCEGAWKAYLEQFGEEELRPIK